MLVLHRCDVRLCVNPDHLDLGTQQKNVDDMIARGRAAQPKSGEDHPHFGRTGAKHPMWGVTGDRHHLTRVPDAVKDQIRALAKAKVFSQAEMVRLFGISQSHVSRIMLGKS